METKINIAEILKDCPVGTELYSTLYGNAIFDGFAIDTPYPIITKIILNDRRQTAYFDEYGRMNVGDCIHSEECLLFPSKDQRDWSKFKKPCLPPFEIYRCKEGEQYYFIDEKGYAIMARDYSIAVMDNRKWKIGNYFNNSEQAEYAAKKVKELLLSLRKE